MKFKKYTLLTILFLFLISISTVAFAASKYVDDGAGVLSSSMQDKISTNFQKVEQNSGAVVKMVTVKSLNKQDVKSVAQDYAKKNISGDKYVLFFVAPNDGKTQFLVGSGLNAVFNSADIDKITHLPDNDFKTKKFDDGFSKVGQAIDQKITSTAVKTGDATVTSNGYSNTVKTAIPWGKYFLIFLIIVIIAIVIFFIVKKIADKNYEDKKKKFAEDNNLDTYNSGNDTFKTASVNYRKSKASNYASSESVDNNTVYNNDSYTTHQVMHETTQEMPRQETPIHKYNTGSSSSSTRHTTINNTTIVNNNTGRHSGYGNDGFVEGMIVGEALNELNHDHHHHHEHDHYDHNDNYYDNHRIEPKIESEITSGNWDNSGTSNWESSNNDSGSSSWDNSCNYDSSSSNDSGSNWNNSDTGNSDW